MKIRPLPDTDVARIAPLSRDAKRKSLEQLYGGWPPFSYRPVRGLYSDIFNLQPDLDFGTSAPTPWAVIEERLAKRARDILEFEQNKTVARSLYDFSISRHIMGRRHEFFPLAMGGGRKLTFWQSMILAIDGAPFAIFIEPRRSRGLAAEGRRFVFSMMHERIRAMDEDFREIGLAVIRFGDSGDGGRAVRLYTEETVTLYTLTELEVMVAETYEMWQEICEERERVVRRRAAGGGSLV